MSVDSNGLNYGAEWHNTYDKFTVLPSGAVIAKPGATVPQQHQPILAVLYEVINMTNTPEFHNEVVAQAKELGYVFPKTREAERKNIVRISEKEIAA